MRTSSESNRIEEKINSFSWKLRFYAPLWSEMFNSHLIEFVPSQFHPKKSHLCGSPFSSFMAGNCTVIPIPPLLAHLLHLYVGSGDHSSDSCIDRFFKSLLIRPCVFYSIPILIFLVFLHMCWFYMWAIGFVHIVFRFRVLVLFKLLLGRWTPRKLQLVIQFFSRPCAHTFIQYWIPMSSFLSFEIPE